MNKFLFFTFMILLASCTKEQAVFDQVSQSEVGTIATRATGSSVEVTCTVVSFEIIIEDGSLNLTDFDTNVEELSILQNQSIDFVNLDSGDIESFEAEVLNFIIIEEGVLELTIPDLDTDLYEIVQTQTLLFE